MPQPVMQPVQQPQMQQTVQQPDYSTPYSYYAATDDNPIPPVTSLSEDELDNIPAYIRRRMKVEAGVLPAGSKISRETLKNDPSSTPRGGGHLFD